MRVLARIGDFLAQGGDALEERGLVVEERIDLDRRLVLRLALGLAPRHPGIETDDELRLIDLAVLFHVHRVDAGQDARALRSGLRQLGGGRHMRRGQVHGPDHPIDPPASARRHLIDDLALRVQHLDLQLAEQMPGALIVGDHRAVGRVVSDERCGAVRPSAVGLDALLRRGAPDERRLLRQHSAVSLRSGVMSSTIQMPRPWVASTRSLSRG